MAACGLVLCAGGVHLRRGAAVRARASDCSRWASARPRGCGCAAKGAATQRQLPAERVIEDEPVDATIEVRRGRLGLPGAEVVDPFTGSRFELSGELSPVKGDRTTNVRVQLAVRPPRPAPPARPPALTVRDPLDLTRAEAVSRTGSQQVLVLPRTEPVRWLGSGHSRRAAPARRSRRLRGDRRRRPRRAAPLPPGTPASRIHWPARGARRRADRAPAPGRRRRPPAGRARRPHAGLRRARRSGAGGRRGARGGVAGARVQRAPAAAGCCCPASSARPMIDRELIAWPAAYARLALVEGGSASRAPVLGPMSGRGGADGLRGRRRRWSVWAPCSARPAAARRCSSCPSRAWSAATRAGCAPRPAHAHGLAAARASCSAPAGGTSARVPRTGGVSRADERRSPHPRPRRRPPAPRPPAQPRAAHAERPWVRLATFTALAGYGLVRWATLVRPEPGWRLVGLLALAVALAGAVPLIARQSRVAAAGASRRDRPPGLPGLGTALALAQAHEHRAHAAPDRARAQPPAQRAGPLPGRQRRRAHGDRAGRGSARPRRRRRARLRRDGAGPGRRTPGGGRASADRAGDRALHAHPARAALHAGAAALRLLLAAFMWGERVRSAAAASAVGVIAAGRRGGSDRGAADRPALTVGRLPRLGGHHGSRPCRHVQLEPDLRPAALAPDRPRGVHGAARARPTATTGRPRTSTPSTATAGSPGVGAAADAAASPAATRWPAGRTPCASRSSA